MAARDSAYRDPAYRDTVSLSVKGLTVDRGGRRVLSGVDLTVGHQSRMAVVGANGVGKTTLLAVMAGRMEATVGRVVVHPPSATVGLLDQDPERSTTETGRRLIARRTGVTAAQQEFEAATEALAADDPGADDRYSDALTSWQELGGFEQDAEVARLADNVGLPLDVLDQPTATLSGGQLTRVGLITIMVSRFDLLLLDEPTNNLDARGLDMLEAWLATFSGPVVLVSHDRRFLEATATSVALLEEHRDGITVFRGGWADYEHQLATARRRAEERYAAYTGERTRIEQAAQRKREWADRGASRASKRPADNDRNRRRYEQASAESQVGAAKKMANRLSKLERTYKEADKPWQPWELRLSIADADRGSTEVAVLDQVFVKRGEFQLGPITEVIRAGDRVLIDGPNGSGKTTLVDVVLGRLEPTAGTVTAGPSVRFGVIGQTRTRFVDGGQVLLGQFAGAASMTETDARSLLAKFGVDAEALSREVETLSPGQRTRVDLALFQATGVNTIVLDEPTNHLDMPAIEQLEQALSTFAGTLIVVTHDRRFREALSITRTILLA